MKNKLKCPFCGGEVHIVVCDNEGNTHNEEYENDPWSGLSFALVHEQRDVPEGRECPIATHDDDDVHLGMWLYDTRKEAIKAWNTKNKK